MLLCTLVILMNACSKFESPLKITKSNERVVQKSVDIKSFYKIDGQEFNFNDHIPTMLQVSGSTLYCSDGDPQHFYAWNMASTNHERSWIKLDNFQGKDDYSRYNLNLGMRRIEKLGCSVDGVLAVISDDQEQRAHASKLGGVAFFNGKSSQAMWSKAFAKPNLVQVQSSKLHDIIEVPSPDGAHITAVVELKAQGYEGKRYVISSLHHERSMFFNGVGERERNRITHKNGVRLSTKNLIGALAWHQHYGIFLAAPDALMNIPDRAIRVRKKAFIEQDAGDALDNSHPKQWSADFAMGTQLEGVVDMALVAEQFLLILVRDAKGNSFLSYADTSKKPFVFINNFHYSMHKSFKIVTNAYEARIISPHNIYSFKDGKITVELSSNNLLRDRIDLKTKRARPFDINNYKGGNVGDVPDDGTDFYDAAAYGDDWYYATDQGLFKVIKNRVSRDFNFAVGD